MPEIDRETEGLYAGEDEVRNDADFSMEMRTKVQYLVEVRLSRRLPLRVERTLLFFDVTSTLSSLETDLRLLPPRRPVPRIGCLCINDGDFRSRQ
jgi:hypothetical protein